MEKFSLFQDIEELKEFLLWAKGERIQKVEVGDVKVEFSHLAFLGTFDDLSEAKTPTNTEPSGSTAPISNEDEPITSSEETDEELLFHSAR